MPTLELDFAEANEVLNEAIKEGGVPEAQAAWLDAFYLNAATQLLALYDRAPLGGWRIYDRQEAAAYWLEHTEATEKALKTLEQSQATVLARGFPEIPGLVSAIQTVREIAEACRGAYELFA
jgi:hypothetical protein